MAKRFFLQDDSRFLTEKMITRQGDFDVFHHLKDVLRAREDQLIEVVYKGKLYKAAIDKIDNDFIYLSNIVNLPSFSEMAKKITIVVPFLKSDHLDFLLQKATELGVNKIILSKFAYSVAKAGSSTKQLEKKFVRYAKIVRSASEQSHRSVIPAIKFEPDFIDKISLEHYQLGLVAWEESAKRGEKSQLFNTLKRLKEDKDKTELIAVFGPEGGLKTEEVDQLVSKGFSPAGLGPRILRAETAPLYLLASASLLVELS
ncbi:RsmE family RNA methyltransferase [Oenococcus alcoholitolerans]|uniref:RsmE family RNA methyltransferase n=1 Tax=Oenococcus alcoholitolerans TaxID=931074 RepID=UPI003F71112C